MSGQPMTAAMLMMTVIIITNWKKDDVLWQVSLVQKNIHTDRVLVGKPEELGRLCV